MRRKHRQIITFTTDFGTIDWFAGTMEGVVATIAPPAQVIRISHDIPPQNLRAGAFALMASYSYFPPGTIHVAIVDPGVGSHRHAIAVKSSRFIFVGPDNGVLSWALRNENILEIRSLESTDLFLGNPSRTFHGRDIFAPVAAHLACAVPFRRLGPKLSGLIRLPWPEPISSGRNVSGEIVYIDRYGNAITNIPADAVESGCDQVRVGRSTLGCAQTYASVPSGAAAGVAGSHGYLEIAVNGGSAERALKLRVGSRIVLKKLQRS